jgi:glucose/arabinose dehydrogenase
MKQLVRNYITCLITLIIFADCLTAQRVYPLVPNVYVDSILKIKPNASKLAMNPLTGRLFYSTVEGNIYEVFIPVSGSSTDSLRYTSANHGITFLQGLCFRDSVLYICGNVWSSTTTIGKVVKAVMQPNGTRKWVNVITTKPYPTASSTGDHGFSGVCIDPDGKNIYVSSGARTHLGEVRTNGGAWPGKREVPLTTRIFKFPIQSEGLLLPNDSSIIDNSGYVFAWGTRNAYDMAWDGNNMLFAIDNSGERDDPEELNWLRLGKHYGYPWRMGSNNNPLRVSPYDVNTDLLVNHKSGGYLSGWFADDPTFPPTPAGITFTDPVRNYGKVADFYRDPFTGHVKNASDEGIYITSFTPHRSPLGLVFDRDSLLAAPFRGNGFVMSFMPGGDSTGYTPLSPWGSPCPFVDPSRELVQMKLTYDAGIDNYIMTTSNIVSGFYLPVDAELKNNFLYVAENGGSIWRVSFPLYTGIEETKNELDLIIYPNPFNKSTTLKFENSNNVNYTVTLYNVFGQIVKTILNVNTNKIEIERSNLPNGLYFIELRTDLNIYATGKLVIE